MTDQFARHEIKRQEIAEHENAGHEHDGPKMTAGSEKYSFNRDNIAMKCANS